MQNAEYKTDTPPRRLGLPFCILHSAFCILYLRCVMSSGAGYPQATRHPWPCLLFLLPLLTAYEVGVVWMGGEQPESLRNGADHWLRCGLMAGGKWLTWLPPVLLLLVFVVWTWR